MNDYSKCKTIDEFILMALDEVSSDIRLEEAIQDVTNEIAELQKKKEKLLSEKKPKFVTADWSDYIGDRIAEKLDGQNR